MALEQAKQLLKNIYGYDSFRPLQESVIENVIQGHDQLVLMPTGGGKSLCYQIPAQLLTGTTIVISPLIALMQDQVTALQDLGIQAAFYNSTQTSEQARKVLHKLHQNELDMLYISPERLLSSNFMQRLQDIPLSLFAIDEAHCISQWGHDFRKDYASLGELKTLFPYVPILALTATADEETRSDIIKRLKINPVVHIASFLRANMHYQVLDKNQPIKQIQRFIAQHPEQSGIIYCSTRKRVEQLTEKLQQRHLSALPYHAGLPIEQRQKTFHAFKHDEVQIVVATIAFGMGIDKSNIRFVIHYDLPKSIEGFYQETGRAGRDGLTADLLLLYQYSDAMTQQALIEQMDNEAQKPIELAKLRSMVNFAESAQCRQQLLLNYFNEPNSEPCGVCDNCLTPTEAHDKTVDAQKALSCIVRLRQTYGMQHVIDVLRGANKKKVLERGHQHLPTYGICQQQSEHELKHLLSQLIQAGYIKQMLSEFNVLHLTEKARGLLKGEVKFFAHPPRRSLHQATASGRKVSTSSQSEHLDEALFKQLKSIRMQLAQTKQVPAFMIFSDASLIDMAEKKPTTEANFLEVHGVGQSKLANYGRLFIKTIEAHLEQEKLLG